MASVRISKLPKFSPEELGDGSDLLVPASKGSIETKTINVKELIDNVIQNSEHEQNQDAKIEAIENIEVWDLETFHDNSNNNNSN